MLRKQSQEDTLAEAQEAVAAARATVDRIERQIASDQGAVQSFTARFSEYKELLEDLGRSSRSIAMP
jgi:peptidoglycan hydrolase CwlO-like protein